MNKKQNWTFVYLVTVALALAVVPSASADHLPDTPGPSDLEDAGNPRCLDNTAGVMCTFCSNNGSRTGSDWSECENGTANHAWVVCAVWDGDKCQLVVGDLTILEQGID